MTTASSSSTLSPSPQTQALSLAQDYFAAYLCKDTEHLTGLFSDKVCLNFGSKKLLKALKKKAKKKKGSQIKLRPAASSPEGVGKALKTCFQRSMGCGRPSNVSYDVSKSVGLVQVKISAEIKRVHPENTELIKDRVTQHLTFSTDEGTLRIARIVIELDKNSTEKAKRKRSDLETENKPSTRRQVH